MALILILMLPFGPLLVGVDLGAKAQHYGPSKVAATSILSTGIARW